MAFYQVSWKQVAFTAATVGVLSASCVFFALTLINFMDLPDVYLNEKNECVKVINFKNGDAYSCPDKDVILRKYHVIRM